MDPDDSTSRAASAAFFTPADAARAADLRRMRGFATGLLVLMALVFGLARVYEPRWPGLGFLRAFAEAAMVGAIADWFAVTALFRHPFGLPIPHTAIIPRNKDRIGHSLGRFIATNFLTEEVVRHKLHSLAIGRHVASWLAVEGNSRFLAERLTASVPAVMAALGEEHARGFVRDGLIGAIRAVEATPMLARILSVLVAHRHHQALFDQMLDVAGRFLLANSASLRQRITERSKWWVPSFVDEALFEKIMAGIDDMLRELRHPEHRWRAQFNDAVEGYVRKLAASPDYRARGEAMKAELLANPLVHQYLDSVWVELRERLARDLAAEDGVARTALTRALVTLGTRLEQDAAMQVVLDRWIERAVVFYVVPYRDRIGDFIAGVVHRWDVGTLTRKLELQVGRDLQFIRINGTLVGGTVGLLIYTLTRLTG